MLLGAFLVLLAINGVSIVLTTLDETLLVLSDLSATILTIVRLEEGNAVAAARRHPLKVGEGIVDWVLLNRVDLIDKLESVVDLITCEWLRLELGPFFVLFV